MTTTREETVRAEHRHAIRTAAVWGVVVPAATLPLVVLGPIVGAPLFVFAVVEAGRTRRDVIEPRAYGAFHWRLVAREFRRAAWVQLAVAAVAAGATAAHWARPASVETAQVAVGLGVVLFFSTLLALDRPFGAVAGHELGLLVERRIGRRVGYEAGRLLMRRSEDVDRRASALFGEPIVSASMESLPPFKAALDVPPDEAMLRDRLAALADSFDEDSDSELAAALRETAAAVEAARAEGVRCRLATVPPYPSDQTLALRGSIRRFA